MIYQCNLINIFFFYFSSAAFLLWSLVRMLMVSLAMGLDPIAVLFGLLLSIFEVRMSNFYFFISVLITLCLCMMIIAIVPSCRNALSNSYLFFLNIGEEVLNVYAFDTDFLTYYSSFCRYLKLQIYAT